MLLGLMSISTNVWADSVLLTRDTLWSFSIREALVSTEVYRMYAVTVELEYKNERGTMVRSEKVYPEVYEGHLSALKKNLTTRLSDIKFAAVKAQAKGSQVICVRGIGYFEEVSRTLTFEDVVVRCP